MALFTTVVHYGKMGHTARVTSDSSEFEIGDPCLVKTERGVEWGKVTSVPRPAEDLRKVSALKIVRAVDDNDVAHKDSLPELERDVLARAEDLVEESELDMHLLGCEVLFGREQIVIYFQAEGRIDFRQMVRSLGSEFATRIEMRQLGDRESARLLGDVGGCGRTLCCKSHLKKFAPVTMKMARVQMTSLQSDKLSGACGRLKCCLRYEYEVYMDLLKNLPRKKKSLTLPDGRRGIVVDTDILAQTMTVDLGHGDRQTFTAGDYLEMTGGGGCSTDGGGCGSGGCGS